MIKTNYYLQPNGFCQNNHCNKELNGEYIYCYECNINKNNQPKKQCSDCKKMIKGDFKRCFDCNIKIKNN